MDFMERSPIITWLFKIRIVSLLAILSLADCVAIWYAYERTMLKGATVQIVFGFEYAILLTIAGTAFVKSRVLIFKRFFLSKEAWLFLSEKSQSRHAADILNNIKNVAGLNNICYSDGFL